MSGRDKPNRRRLRWVTGWGLARIGAFLTVLIATFMWGFHMMVEMPGRSYTGPLLPLSEHERRLRDNLRRHVEKLAGEIGERNVERPTALRAAADTVAEAFAAAGYTPVRQTFSVKGVECQNIEVERPGTTRPYEIVVVGGHYDSVHGCPGANDNGTGTAAVLELARLFANKELQRTLRFVAFTNEEPPHFQTETMGSRIYAARCASRGDNIVSMVSLETMGFFSDEEESQRYPPLLSRLYPSTGNFIGFVGNVSSRKLVRKAIETFREQTKFPSEGGAIIDAIPGIGWSDHWSFWQEGYPAIMVTDTAPFRYPHYHLPTDTPDKIDYDRLARVIAGIERVIEMLADSTETYGEMAKKQ